MVVVAVVVAVVAVIAFVVAAAVLIISPNHDHVLYSQLFRHELSCFVYMMV